MNERKRQVILTAQRLFIQKGFLSTSIQDILDEAGISKGTFYNYFSSKNECLLAILENVREKTFIRRQELLIGRDPSDKEILCRQIEVRFIMNRENNLLPIYEEIYHSRDEGLRLFVKKHHYYELYWLSERIKEVYGSRVEKHAYDCAVMLFGIIQHFLQAWRITSLEDVRLEDLIFFAVRRLDAIVDNVVETGDCFFDGFAFPEEKGPSLYMSKVESEIKDLLMKFEQSEDDTIRQYAEFLTEEIERNQPRPYLMESIAESLRNLPNNNKEYDKARKLAFLLSRYVEGNK